ncbi:MAG: flagellar basal body L-ring protein FlgH [Phycisphaerae bacterium]
MTIVAAEFARVASTVSGRSGLTAFARFEALGAMLLFVFASALPAVAQSNSLFRVARQNATSAAAARVDPPRQGANALQNEAGATGPAQPQRPGEPQPLTPTASTSPGITPLAEVARPASANGARPGATAVSRNYLPTPPANPALAGMSLIAVQIPQPEKIGVHDLVTIIIREDKRATSDSKLQSDKEWKLDATLAQWLRLDTRDHLVPQNFPGGAPGAQFDINNKYDGQGKIDRKDSLITRITATVIDVKPNGNLVLEAKKSIKTDEEVQLVTLTGACRSRDVTAENTVLSTQVADMQISVEHTGAARDAARRGWLMKAFDALRPF